MFPWGIPRLQSDWSLSCDHGLDYARTKTTVTFSTMPREGTGDHSDVLQSYIFFLFFFFFPSHIYFPASGQAVVTGVVLSPPQFLPSIFIAHRVQQSHYSSIFHRVLLTHALALSASQFVRKKKSQRIYTSMHSAGLELTKLTYIRLEDNLIRHRGDRQYIRYVDVLTLEISL